MPFSQKKSMRPAIDAKSKAIRFIVLLAIFLSGLLAMRFFDSKGEKLPNGSAAAAGEDFDTELRDENSVRLGMVRQPVADEEPTELAPSIRIPWQAGQTLFEATRLAGIKSSQWQSNWQGEAEMALLIELGGFTNEGPEGLNWQFDHNGNYGKRGAGQTVLNAGDHALWRLAPYE